MKAGQSNATVYDGERTAKGLWPLARIQVCGFSVSIGNLFQEVSRLEARSLRDVWELRFKFDVLHVQATGGSLQSREHGPHLLLHFV